MKKYSAYQISESEEVIMNCLQEYGEMSLHEIKEKIQSKQNWSESTIKTFIHRMCVKGALIAEKREVYYYKPTYTKKEQKYNLFQEFIKRTFDGSLQELMLNYLENSQISTDEIDEIKYMLENYSKESERLEKSKKHEQVNDKKH